MTVQFINKTWLNQKVKVIFKERDSRITMIGKFVNIGNPEKDNADFKELASKNMIRFVNQSRLDYWQDDVPNVGLTKIYKADDFALITLVNG